MDSSASDSVPAKGTIIAVSVRNFMTFGEAAEQKPLQFEFEPHVNILSGPNGLGKSSLASAIMLCCGNGAEFLGRGSSLTDFIKHGKDSCEIELILSDPGADGGQTTLKREFRRKGQQKFRQFIDGELVAFKDYAKKLREFHIQRHNLTQFLPQERVSDFAKMTPSELLRSTEEAMGEDVAEMHDQLVDMRKEWLVKSQNLKDLSESHQQNLAQQNELDTELRKLRLRNEKAELLMALRAKTLAMEIAALGNLASTTSAENLRQQKLLEENVKLVHANALILRGKTMQSIEKDVPERFPGAVPAVTRTLNLEASKDKKQEQDRKELQESLNDAEEVAHWKRLETLKSNVSELEKSVREMDDPVTLEERKQSHEDQLKEIQTLLEEATSVLSELEQIKHLRTTRMADLIECGVIDPDVITVWNWVQKNYPDKVFGPLFFYIWPKNEMWTKYVENAFAKVLPYFLCEDKEIGQEMMEELNKKQRLCFGLICLQSEQNGEVSLASEELRTVKRFGFNMVLDDCFEANGAVSRCLRKLFSTGTYFVGSSLGDQEAMNLASYWERKIPGINHERGLLRCATKESIYEEMEGDDGKVIYITPLKDPCILEFDNDVKDQESAYRGLMENISALREHPLLSDSDNATDIENIVKSLKKRETEALTRQAHIEDEIRSSQQNSDALKAARARLAEETQEDVKPRVSLIDTLAARLGNFTMERMELLLGDQLVNNMEMINNTVPEFFDATFSSIGFLLDIGVWCSFFQNCQRQKKRLMDAIKNGKQDLFALQQTKATKEAVLQTVISDAFLARGKNVSYMKSMMKKIATKNSLKDLTHATLIAWNDYVQSEKVDMQKVRDLKTMLGTSRSDNVLHQNNLEFALNLSKISQSVLRERWQQKLEHCLRKMSATMNRLLGELGYSGGVELLLPSSGDDREVDGYGIDLLVDFDDGNGEAFRLNHHRQSGGERGVATAVFLLALQDCSSVPFRIVDEINQGMDTYNEQRIFQLVVDGARTSKTQLISISPKGPPPFESSEDSPLNFCFLMRSHGGAPRSYRAINILTEMQAC